MLISSETATKRNLSIMYEFVLIAHTSFFWSTRCPHRAEKHSLWPDKPISHWLGYSGPGAGFDPSSKPSSAVFLSRGRILGRQLVCENETQTQYKLPDLPGRRLRALARQTIKIAKAYAVLKVPLQHIVSKRPVRPCSLYYSDYLNLGS